MRHGRVCIRVEFISDRGRSFTETAQSRKKIELRWLSGVVTSSAENVRSSLRSRSTVLSYKQKVMEKGDMVSNDSKSYFQMRKPNVWPLQEIVGLSVGDGSQSSVLIKDEADE